MDNSRYYNDSLAYDFDMFLPKEKTVKAKIVKMPRKKSVSSKRASVAVAQKIKTGAVIGFILAVVCANIFLRARITEVNAEISAVETEITELESEYTRLNVEFENRISYQNIEQVAKSLGMKKMDKSQVVYIKTNPTNAAVTSNGVFSASQE